ncbi:hypothetical protein KIH41_16375 [Litoribacter ruber]|uniref:Wzz/FepE/Etk N-terminal domain-containing protein n=1 Tax=Litoribacter ruber TaxID=702568 RepID=UPI001BDAC4C4|nr:Wzz/FepE/Etk N-terminal domain-containing protein [Litoribacter ruber]MBT0812864.1 hypothetical protein [Litoribacter ruber]
MEITLKEIVERIISQKWLIVKVVLVFILLALVIIFTTTREFTASSKIIVENPGAQRGMLSQLGNLPGLNLGNLNQNDNILSHEIYPEIINSNDFFLTVLNSKIALDGDSLILKEFVESVYSPSLLQQVKKYTIGLPQLFKSSTALNHDGSRIESGITFLSGEDGRNIGWLRKRINLNVERGTRITTISFESPNSEVSAQVVQLTSNYLQSYLDEYQTQKEVRNLEFVEERKEEARKQYLQAQQELASFRDRNRNVMSEVSRTREEVLVQDFNLTNRIYSLLAEQTEQARIKSKEQGVMFKVLERVQLPAPQTKPQPVLLLMLFILTGLILSISYILFPIIFNEFYEKDPDGRSKVTV